MRRVFFKYFGLSLDKRERDDLCLGISITSDNIVYIGAVISIIKWNIGLWVHKKDFIVSCKTSCTQEEG